MQWFIYSHCFIYQWINSFISSHATSESVSMTSILNAMIYSLSSFYLSMNLIIHSYATSEFVIMTSSKSISLMSKLISEFASMTFILNTMIYLLSSFYSSVNLIIYSHAINESATMMSSKSISSISKSISKSASMTSVNSWFLCWASQFFST